MPQLFDQDAAEAPAFTCPWSLVRWPEMQRRLAYAGATAQEIADFEEAWLHDEHWPFEDRERLWAKGDGQLRQEVLHAREVNRHNLETADDEARRVVQERGDPDRDALQKEALEWSAWEPSAVLRWVDGDPNRARASLTVEEEHPRPRSELVSALLAVLERPQ